MLWAISKAQKKKFEEVRAGFAIEKRALMEDYQKQVDEMFFFGYQCCIRKNDITQDTSYYPSDDEEEDATVSGRPTKGDKDLDVVDVVGPFGGQ